MSIKTLHSGRYLSLVSRDGWEYATRENASGVAVLIAVTDADEIVLVEQHRVPLDAAVVELPAGLVGDGDNGDEPMLDAAGRELIEETGFAAAHLEIAMAGPTSAGLSDEMVTFVQATGLTRVGEGGGVDDEDITVHVVPMDKVHDWLEARRAAGTIIEPKVYTGLYWAQRYLGSE